jgi:hypothetical protein
MKYPILEDGSLRITTPVFPTHSLLSWERDDYNEPVFEIAGLDHWSLSSVAFSHWIGSVVWWLWGLKEQIMNVCSKLDKGTMLHRRVFRKLIRPGILEFTDSTNPRDEEIRLTIPTHSESSQMRKFVYTLSPMSLSRLLFQISYSTWFSSSMNCLNGRFVSETKRRLFGFEDRDMKIWLCSWFKGWIVYI